MGRFYIVKDGICLILKPFFPIEHNNCITCSKTLHMLNPSATSRKIINVLIDYCLLNTSLITVYNIIHHSSTQWLNDRPYLNVLMIFNLLWMLAANLVTLYKSRVDNNDKTFQKVILTYIVYLVLVCLIIMSLNSIRTYFVSREYLLASMTLFGVFLGVWRSVFSKARGYFITNGPTKTAIIVGGGRAAKEIYSRYKNNQLPGYTLLGMFDDQPSNIGNKELYLGNTKSCINYVLENKVNEIICVLPFSEHETIERLIKDSDKNLIRFKLVPEHYEYLQGSLFEQSISNIQALSIRVEPLEDLITRATKRLFDILFSSFVIVFVLSWLYPIIAFLIKLDSEGPVFFTQMRSGRDNNPFTCFKFRTMKVNKDSDSLQATKNDCRVTKIGAFLRKTSLDEFPQFFNVLLGHMSIVGPRPHMLKHTTEYSNLVDQFMVRHFIKPGITGWAQVNGLRGETKTVGDMHDRVKADVWYMENWSFMLDLKIIFLTAFNILQGEKNAF